VAQRHRNDSQRRGEIQEKQRHGRHYLAPQMASAEKIGITGIRCGRAATIWIAAPKKKRRETLHIFIFFKYFLHELHTRHGGVNRRQHQRKGRINKITWGKYEIKARCCAFSILIFIFYPCDTCVTGRPQRHYSSDRGTTGRDAKKLKWEEQQPFWIAASSADGKGTLHIFLLLPEATHASLGGDMAPTSAAGTLSQK